MKATITSTPSNQSGINSKSMQFETQAPIIESIIETIIEPIIYKC
jgi:hypothetical protein